MFKDPRLQELANTNYRQSIFCEAEGQNVQGVLNNLIDPVLRSELNMKLSSGEHGKICTFELHEYRLGIAFAGLPDLFYVWFVNRHQEQRSLPLRAYQVQSVLLSFCVQLNQAELIRRSLNKALNPEL